MFRNLRLANKIVLGFALVLLVSTAVTAFAIMYMGRIADTTETMFEHPYTAHTAALEIKAKVTAMAAEMKDLVLTGNRETREALIATVSELNAEVLALFDILYDRFLGDHVLLDEAFTAFNDWEALRGEIYKMLDVGYAAQAMDLTRGQGAKQLDLVQDSIQRIVDDAKQRATLYNSNARQSAEVESV